MSPSDPTLGPRRSSAPDGLLLPGDYVEVLPASEILRTLDAEQALEGLPFMPEMLAHCGRRYRVALRAERMCVNPPERPFRQMRNAVVLEGLRCDGALHGGCQLGCMFLWKDAWLRRVSAGQREEPVPEAVGTTPLRATRASDPTLFYCQATELRGATEPGVPTWSPGQYLHFLRVRTFTLPELIAMFGRPALRRARWLLGSLIPGRAAPATTIESRLGLQPGDWVEVRSRGEILQTLDARGHNKGLSFGTDQYRLSGHRLRVAQRVELIVDEASGRLRAMSDTVILEGSICDRYRGCARGMPVLWREAWLKRVEQTPAATTSDQSAPPRVPGA